MSDCIQAIWHNFFSSAQAATGEAPVAGEDEGEEDDGAGDGKLQEDVELLEQINESKKENGGRIEDSILLRLFKDTLKSMRCQNQGFVLDGFPKLYEQAKELFAGGYFFWWQFIFVDSTLIL